MYEKEAVCMKWGKRPAVHSAMAFIIFMGIVSLFSDMTHEGARSIYGNYLSLLGASAAVIGFTCGFGEFVGYSLRFITGYLADRTKKYWPMTILGYAINVIAIPLLAILPTDGWFWAAVFICTERIGKAIRQPAKNTLVSFAASQQGMGKGFAIQEFMDQIGAFLGPVLVFLVLAFHQGDLLNAYTLAFAILGIPAAGCITAVLLARKHFPHPENFEPPVKTDTDFHAKKSFIFYIIAVSLFAFGFTDFPLITMHLANQSQLSTEVLPLTYAAAMLMDAFAALAFGWLFDTYGMKTLIVAALIAAPFSYFIFMMHTLTAVWIGVILWGIGMGAQESIMKSALSTIVPKTHRSTGFGIFETSFGVFWFAGSFLLGVLYDISIPLMVLISIGAQVLSIPFFVYTNKFMHTAKCSL
jgi:MFS family permease